MHLQFDKGGLRFFFFTAAIRGRQPLLSRIVPRAPGRQRPGEASPEPPRSGRRDPRAGWGVELSPAGEAVARLWREVHARDPFLTASDFILMPDHAHLLLLVDYRRAPAGFDLLGWWLRFRRETAAAAAAALPGIEPSAFWEEKYWIMILNAGTSLSAVRRYIKLNPARLDPHRGAWPAAALRPFGGRKPIPGREAAARPFLLPVRGPGIPGQLDELPHHE